MQQSHAFAIFIRYSFPLYGVIPLTPPDPLPSMVIFNKAAIVNL